MRCDVASRLWKTWLSAYLWAASYHPEVEITEQDWPLPISYSRWFKDFNRQNHNLKGPQKVFMVSNLILEVRRVSLLSTTPEDALKLVPPNLGWETQSMAQKATKVTMKVFSSSENQLLNIHQHTIDTFITQNNFVEEKKILTPTNQKPNKLKRNLAIFTGKSPISLI